MIWITLSIILIYVTGTAKTAKLTTPTPTPKAFSIVFAPSCAKYGLSSTTLSIYFFLFFSNFSFSSLDNLGFSSSLLSSNFLPFSIFPSREPLFTKLNVCFTVASKIGLWYTSPSLDPSVPKLALEVNVLCTPLAIAFVDWIKNVEPLVVPVDVDTEPNQKTNKTTTAK